MKYSALWIPLLLIGCGEAPVEEPTEALSTPIPDRPMGIDGLWLVEASGALEMYNDLNGSDTVDFESWSLIRFEDGGQVSTQVCRLNLGTYDGGIMEVELDVPDAAVQPGTALSPAEANFDGGWAEDNYAAHLLILAGFESQGDAWTEPLPNGEAQTLDHDEDGLPGVTIPVFLRGKEGTIGEGENAEYAVYVAHRLGQILNPVSVTADEMRGQVDVSLDIAIVGSDNPLLAEQEILTETQEGAWPDFVALPVDGQSTCTEILANLGD